MPSSLGAQLALIQANLMMRDNKQKAVELLDTARLLAPGTLVEEAALRREIFTVDENEDLEKFVTLSRQYIFRFKNSVFAENFRTRFASSLTSIALRGDGEKFRRLDTLIAEFSPDIQRTIYLSVAQATLINGKILVTRFAAEKALQLSKPGSVDEARSRLYYGGAQILTNEYDAGNERIENVKLANLPPRDQELRDAVLTVAKIVRRWPKEFDSDTPDAPPAGADGAAIPSVAQAMALAEKSIADTDVVLKGSAK
jgi:chemotaxis protein MotC